ncbi:hypothetical protein [Nocardia sp. alder85J]|uniref:hypothetical protein n=1 Tax=Nocardia sp. alder85J TaxID=2862949 RepID=UPI001CD419A4|nr:hypothetical protein [Nocardia sp. alder85J]MCX4098332.1 hypothetical protein [Nocardia sp. alder85J]
MFSSPSLYTTDLTAAVMVHGDINVRPTPPPGSQGLLNIVNWLAWGSMVAGIAALIYAGGKFGWERMHGGAMESPKIVFFALIGGVLMTSAGAIMNAVVSAQ